MANTYTLISTYTVGSGGINEVSFSGLTNAYTHFQIHASVRCSNSGTDAQVQIDVGAGYGAGYSVLVFQAAGSGTPIGSSSSTGWMIGGTNANNNTANTFGTFTLLLPNATNSSYAKSGHIFSGQATGSTPIYTESNFLQFSSTSAISTIKMRPSASVNFMQYSVFSLYGLTVS